MEKSVFAQFKKPTTAQRYAVAVLSAAFALVLRGILSPLYGTSYPYLTLSVAIVFSASYCGLGAAILTTVLGVIGAWYFFIPAPHSFHMEDPKTGIAGIIGFAVLSSVIIFIGEANRRLRQSLQKSREELEQQVLNRTRELQRTTSELLQKATLLDLANDGIFVRNADGRISYWNKGAERLYGWTSEEAVGRSTQDVLRTEFPVSMEEIEMHDFWEGELRHTRRDGSQITVASRWTTLRGSDGKRVAWLEINTDITRRKNAENAARKLSGRILTLQDDERRKIARGLHDSLGQYLAALKMSLSLLSSNNGNHDEIVSECSNIVDNCLSETRTISHLLHPPLLDEAGLQSAIQWYIEGFSQRSGIKVTVDLPTKLDRFDSEIETTLFRAVQEGLTNVHRHSYASQATIRVVVDSKYIRLEVSDNGKGMRKDRLRNVLESGGEAGVGLAGMRERVRDLGGSLSIKSDKTGTTLGILIPVKAESAVVDEDEKGQRLSTA